MQSNGNIMILRITAAQMVIDLYGNIGGEGKSIDTFLEDVEKVHELLQKDFEDDEKEGAEVQPLRPI